MKYIFLFLSAFLLFSCSEIKKKAAEVDGSFIYLDEVDAIVEQKLYYYMTEIYETRYIALTKLIETKIFQYESAKRGLEYKVFLDSLYKTEIYNVAAKKHHITYVRDSTGTFDISFEQGKDLMLRREERALRKRWVDSLSTKYNVKYNLKRPDKLFLIDMRDVKCYYKKDVEFPLTVWVISDFDCSVCQELQPMFEYVLKKYYDKVNFAFVFYSEMVSMSAIAAECAENQGKFWEMKDMLYDGTVKNINKYVKYANKIGIDTIQFKKDLVNPEIYKMISNNMEILGEKGVFGTPTIVIGKRMYVNINDEKELSLLIDRHLKNLK